MRWRPPRAPDARGPLQGAGGEQRAGGLGEQAAREAARRAHGDGGVDFAPSCAGAAGSRRRSRPARWRSAPSRTRRPLDLDVEADAAARPDGRTRVRACPRPAGASLSTSNGTGAQRAQASGSVSTSQHRRGGRCGGGGGGPGLHGWNSPGAASRVVGPDDDCRSAAGTIAASSSGMTRRSSRRTRTWARPPVRLPADARRLRSRLPLLIGAALVVEFWAELAFAPSRRHAAPVARRAAARRGSRSRWSRAPLPAGRRAVVSVRRDRAAAGALPRVLRGAVPGVRRAVRRLLLARRVRRAARSRSLVPCAVLSLMLATARSPSRSRARSSRSRRRSSRRWWSAGCCAAAPRSTGAARAGGAARTPRAQDAAGRAVVDERTRIAGELHDVVAHALSAMTVQATGARRLALTRPGARARRRSRRSRARAARRSTSCAGCWACCAARTPSSR